MERTFEGKTIVITGAGGFIGGECAEYLARRGAKLALADLSSAALEKTAARVAEAGGEAFCRVTDVTDSADVNALIADTVDRFGELYASVHVAGGSARIAGPEAKYVELTEQEDYVIDRVLKVNLYGAIYLARAAGRQLKAQGKGGRILSFSSVVGQNGLKTCVDYAAAKGGVTSMTKALAKELGPYGITVNAVSPGVVARPEADANLDYQLKTNFLGKRCLASHVSPLVAFLLSEEAEFITGQTYIADGGRSLAMKGTD